MPTRTRLGFGYVQQPHRREPTQDAPPDSPQRSAGQAPVAPTGISEPERAPLARPSSRQLRRRGLPLEYATLVWNAVGSVVVLHETAL